MDHFSFTSEANRILQKTKDFLREYVWRDTNANFVFFHKYHWN